MFGETTISIHFHFPTVKIEGSWNHPSSHFAMWMWRMWLSLVKFHLFHHLKHEFIKWCRKFHLHVLSFRLDENLERSIFFGGWSWYVYIHLYIIIYKCVRVFLKLHNFSMSMEHVVGIWQSESFIEKYLPIDVSPLENQHSHLKNDAWKCLEDEICFRYGPWIQGDMSIFSILQEFKELLLAWDLSRVGSTAPWFFYAKKRRSQG